MAQFLVLLLAFLTPIWTVSQPATYPVHENIQTTMFYVGETASADNDYISNESSVWVSDWVNQFGCVDDPNDRIGYLPKACFDDGKMGPAENPFYFALPFGDYDEHGVLDQVKQIPWYDEASGETVYAEGGSILKNRWIKIIHVNPDTGESRTAYAQWLDVGPGSHQDGAYVWGDAQPIHPKGFGLDVSPAVNDYLGLNGLGRTSWQFVEYEQVPDGWWKAVVSSSSPNWSQ